MADQARIIGGGRDSRQKCCWQEEAFQVGCRMSAGWCWNVALIPAHTCLCCVLNNGRMRCGVFIKTCHHGAGHHRHNVHTCPGPDTIPHIPHSGAALPPWIFITTLHWLPSTTAWTHNTGSWLCPVSRVMAGARQLGQVAAATQQINRYLLSKGDLVWIRVPTVFAWTIIRQVMFWWSVLWD